MFLWHEARCRGAASSQYPGEPCAFSSRQVPGSTQPRTRFVSRRRGLRHRRRRLATRSADTSRGDTCSASRNLRLAAGRVEWGCESWRDDAPGTPLYVPPAWSGRLSKRAPSAAHSPTADVWLPSILATQAVTRRTLHKSKLVPLIYIYS